tara:strand:- start:1032 stop:1430 length:399 start_codon:yes stop_codon:yes gene_type:complete
MTTELWTPPEVTDYTVSPVGYNAETGGLIGQHIFQVHDAVTDKRHKFCVLTDEYTSQAHLEDMVSSAVERWLVEVREKDHKPAPTPEQRKEIGKILDEIRVHRSKRSESTGGRMYYSGLKGVRNGSPRDADK